MDGSKEITISVIHPVHVSLADSLDYRTYRLHNRSPRYARKFAASTSKLDKQMKRFMKPYKLADYDPVTILSFLGNFKRACDSNRVSEVVTM